MAIDLKEKALQLAISVHKERVRKSDGSPYVAHPIMVGFILREYGFNDVVVAAGFVHDVLEDTDVTEEELKSELGAEVTEYVTAVSEDTSLEWEKRKELYAESVAEAAEGAKAVSIADKIHNAESIINDYEIKGVAVWEVFNRGKEKKMWFEELVYQKVAESWRHPILERYRIALDTLHSLDD